MAQLCSRSWIVPSGWTRLSAIMAVGGDGRIEEVFAARRRQLSDRVREQLADRVSADASIDERVRGLAEIQAAQGYLADSLVQPDGTIQLREHNCAIYHVAKGTPSACQAELDLFRDVLGADVVRESHIAAGDRCCSYRISERADQPPA